MCEKYSSDTMKLWNTTYAPYIIYNKDKYYRIKSSNCLLNISISIENGDN